MKQLERLLFLQGYRCFFCQQPIPMGEASVEHLVATSLGGTHNEENCVVCCKAINTAFGNLSIKAKLQVVLNQRGVFTCPLVQFPSVISTPPTHASSPTSPAAPPVAMLAASTVAASHSQPPALEAHLPTIVRDLKKRGTARPHSVVALKNTLNCLFRMQKTDEELVRLVNALEQQGYIRVQGVQVIYAWPS